MYRNREDQRSIQAKTRLYRALAHTMREKEFPSITIKEVVQAAQVGRSTFYRNFDHLEAILLWKCDEAFADLYRYIVQSLTRTPADTAGKYPFILPFFRYWQEDSEIVELLIAANRIDVIVAAFETTTEKLVLALQPAVRKEAPYFDYFLAFRSGAIVHVLLHWIRHRKNLSPEQLHQFIEAQSEGLV
ncbi:TetR/AcrR family transcriptional regulator [Cohnella fermenti]|uniref:TetR/AcrR family transcriptional regulator n=1 Tax=Cohnella fermenti TaxID=2565925 RepID=A0A4S4BI68_9BACL|nr:TetR-like C-terminal domain-containing protein [Cohnella fermenti]THF74291.1 TetR/AcrR family transcriptional regulator [Cohnella fermenti]